MTEHGVYLQLSFYIILRGWNTNVATLIATRSTISKIVGGNSWRDFELARRPSFAVIDKSIQKLRKIYREKPEWFEIPAFAQKTYSYQQFALEV
jgi:hypothetical protein